MTPGGKRLVDLQDDVAGMCLPVVRTPTGVQ
jgi:hypothetical protein